MTPMMRQRTGPASPSDDSSDTSPSIVSNAATLLENNLSLPQKTSSILGTSSNLVKTIVGAGIIGIPYAFRMCGLIAGILLLIIVAVLTVLTGNGRPVYN